MIKLPKLISDKIEEFLNASIKKEMDSAQIYYGMAAWLNTMGYDNGYQLFIKYGDEEIKHAHKIMDYLDNRNAKAVVPVVAKPNQEFSHCYDVIQAAYDHEVLVENNYKTLCSMAMREGDHTTYELGMFYRFIKYFSISKSTFIIRFYHLNKSSTFPSNHTYSNIAISIIYTTTTRYR